MKNALTFVANGAIPKLHAPATGEEILARLTEAAMSPAPAPALTT